MTAQTSIPHAVPHGAIVLIAYWTVLVAELLGDKSIYTIASLGLRFPIAIVFAALTGAFATKVLMAVGLAHQLERLAIPHVGLISGTALLASALFLWLRGEEHPEARRLGRTGAWGPFTACFSSIFIIEWGDPGQVAAAALTLQVGSVWAPWLGGTLALMTKGALALWLGTRLRDRLPLRTLRFLAIGTCCGLAILTIGESLFG